VRHDEEGRHLVGDGEERVNFERSFLFAELRPRKEGETDVDDRGVQRVERIVDVEMQILRREDAALGNKCVEETLEDVVVALLHCMSEGVALHGGDAEVIQLAVPTSESRLDFPQRDLPGELGVDEDGKLIPAGEVLHVPVAVVLSHKRLKLCTRKKVQELSQHRGSMGHTKRSGKGSKDVHLESYRSFLACSGCKLRLKLNFLGTAVKQERKACGICKRIEDAFAESGKKR